MTAPVASVEEGARGSRLPAIDRVQRAAIIDLVRHGAPPTTAAVKCGVSRRTHDDWLRRGRKTDGPEPCKRYVDDIDHAIEEWKYGRIQAVEAHEEEDWRAAMTLLERRFPKEFGQRKQIDGQIQVQAMPMIAWEKLRPERAELLVELLREAAPDAEDPALNENARPALELLAGHEIIEHEG